MVAWKECLISGNAATASESESTSGDGSLQKSVVGEDFFVGDGKESLDKNEETFNFDNPEALEKKHGKQKMANGESGIEKGYKRNFDNVFEVDSNQKMNRYCHQGRKEGLV